MATSYELGADPIWYIADNVGRPLGGGYMVPSSSLNPTLRKFVYKDAGGPLGAGPWPLVPIPNLDPSIRGILFNENGQQGPFYFAFDTGNPDDLYFLQVFDSSGNLVWTVDDYDASGGGGGSVITTVQNAQNLITNNVFWRHIPDVPAIGSAAFKVAPSVHSALAQTPANAGPDIYFIKTNTTATDSLTFPTFASLYGYGVNELADDVQPVDFLKYTSTVAGNGELKKDLQIPISQNVLNLSGTVVTISFWVISLSGIASTINLYWRQFFGDGTNGPTSDVVSLIASIPVTTSWEKQTISVTVPSVATLVPPAVVGSCHNDGLFLLFRYPLNDTCSIGLTKPSLYLNNILVKNDYQTYDQIDAVINAPRTGHTVSSIDATVPLGYLAMNDTTIGSATSLAVTHDDYTFPLYNIIWNATNTNATTQSWAPVTGGRGVSAIADFSANKPMQILYALGAVIGNVGLPNATFYLNAYGTYLAGAPFGHDQDTAPLPTHVHAALSGTSFVETTGIGSGTIYQTGGTGTSHTTTAAAGAGVAPLHNTVQPTLRLNYFIKL
jgi:hypothetical protein